MALPFASVPSPTSSANALASDPPALVPDTPNTPPRAITCPVTKTLPSNTPAYVGDLACRPQWFVEIASAPM